MKLSTKIIAVFSFLLLLISANTIAQTVKWQEKSNNKNATFYQVLQDFNQHWQGKRIGKGQGYKNFKRWQEFMAPRVYPSGSLALPSTYQNFMLWQQGRALQRPGPGQTNTILSTGNWIELGQFSKPTGYDAGVGRVDFIKFNPTNNNIAYVSTPDGGLWKTTNVSAALPSWTTNADFLPVIGTSELAIAPDGNTMYVATGSWEGDKRSGGILKSTDGGTTWNTTSVTFAATDNYFIRRLQMDPTNPLIMMAATDGGIFRTTDGWATNSLTTLDGNYNIQDIKFKPTDHNTVYASGKTGLNTSVFYKSTDNGVTWATITSGLPLSSDVSRIILAVTPADPNYVYALAGNADGGYKGLYRSTNSGNSFTAQSTSPNILGGDVPAAGTSGQAGHDLAIAVSPTDVDMVTIGGISQWRSTNGGVNWNILTYWFGADPLNPGGNPVAPYLHADVQSIQYMPGSSTTLFTSSDGGIYRSTDNGVSWTDISNNLRISQQTDVANSGTTAGLIVNGLQDIGTVKTNSGVSTYIGGGDGESSFIDRTNDLNIVTSDPNGNHRLSTDGGTIFNDLNGNGLPAGTEFFSPILQDPITSTTCYAAGRPDLYKSTNFLAAPSHTWTSIGTPSGTGSIFRFAIYPANTQIIYTLKADAVSKTINGGTSWTNVTGSLPVGSASIRNITISNTDPNKVWVVFSGYSAGDKVYKTINGGASWTDVSSTSLPNIPINTIVYRNNSATDEVYIGADIGVYVIDNTMSTWALFFTGLARSIVTDLEIFYPTGKIRAATYGRGSWESDLNSIVLPIDLVKFDVTLKGKNDALLQWQTATESNTKGYEIEMAQNILSSYKYISFVQGKGNSSTLTNYQTVVPNLAPDTYYFRLKMIDLDGKFKYSSTQILKVSADDIVRIYPNPSKDGFVFIELATPANKKINIKVMNASGQVVNNKDFANYVNPLKIKLPAISGEYYIQITTVDGDIMIRKLIVVK